MLPSSQQFGGRPLKHAVKVTTLAAVPKQMERQRSTEATQMAEVAERAHARASCQIQNSETLGELLSRRLARSRLRGEASQRQAHPEVPHRASARARYCAPRCVRTRLVSGWRSKHTSTLRGTRYARYFVCAVGSLISRPPTEGLGTRISV